MARQRSYRRSHSRSRKRARTQHGGDLAGNPASSWGWGLGTVGNGWTQFVNAMTLQPGQNLATAQGTQLVPVNNINANREPLRFKLLSLNTTIENKIVILRKYEELLHLEKNSSEYGKLFKWITTITYIPFGIYKEINYKNKGISNFLNDIKIGLDKNIYGHTETKQQLIRILAQYISNPNAKGYVIGIQGSMGVGKTKFIKDGIAKVIGFPLAFIALGGSSDSNYLKGHSYTYEGSTYGKIAEQLIKTKVMNPIFFFDELDKVAEDRHGDEIINTLIHITDGTQNEKFTDKYFEELDIDLSKSIIFFTFNDINRVNPILRDRMIIIKIDKYSREDKLKLTKHSLLENIYKSFNFKENDVELTDEMIYYIIDNTTEEDGVRNLQRNINNIYSYINMNKYLVINGEKIKFPFKIEKDYIDKYLIMKRDKDKNILSMYL
jgi:ATP-dependent Lon protease